MSHQAMNLDTLTRFEEPTIILVTQNSRDVSTYLACSPDCSPDIPSPCSPDEPGDDCKPVWGTCDPED